MLGFLSGIELMSKNKTFKKAFVSFLLLNLLLYLFIINFYKQIPFDSESYINNFHHFFEDPRIKGGEFNFLNALGQSDAQWYLKIASSGYPKNPRDIFAQDYKGSWEELIYAFFPLYPVILHLLNFIFKNIELTAFIVANLLMMANFISLYFVVSKLFNIDVAVKTIFLIFTFPFSIFFRSYYPEGLYLFLLIWFSYFLIKKRLLLAAFILGLMNITRGNGLFLNLIILYYLMPIIQQKNSLSKVILILILLMTPFLGWMYFNYLQTGDYLYFYSTQSHWYSSENILSPLIQNIKQVFSFPKLSFHLFHSSQIDVIILLISLSFLIKSRKSLPPILWLIGLSLSALPLLVKDLISFSRYQIIVYPLFIYSAYKLKDREYGFLLGAFFVLLLLASLYFVNWYWIG